MSRKTKVLEDRFIPLSKLRGSMCAWAGCTASYLRADGMPKGWTFLQMYWSPEPVPNFLDVSAKDQLRDAVLCPEHTRVLDRQLKDIGRDVGGPAAGNA
jgi:hypothetical protein